MSLQIWNSVPQLTYLSLAGCRKFSGNSGAQFLRLLELDLSNCGNLRPTGGEVGTAHSRLALQTLSARGQLWRYQACRRGVLSTCKLQLKSMWLDHSNESPVCRSDSSGAYWHACNRVSKPKLKSHSRFQASPAPHSTLWNTES